MCFRKCQLRQKINYNNKIQQNSNEDSKLLDSFNNLCIRKSLLASKACKIALYYPFNYEINCLLIAKYLIQKGHEIILPKVEIGSKVLSFHLWRTGDPLCDGLLKNKEPKVNSILDQIPEILIIPLKAFDIKGNRLGRGGGYYDATISYLRSKYNVVVIGAGFNSQMVDNIVSDCWDQPLDFAITDKSYIVFNK